MTTAHDVTGQPQATWNIWTCSLGDPSAPDMFKLVYSGTHPGSYMGTPALSSPYPHGDPQTPALFKLVHYAASGRFAFNWKAFLLPMSLLTQSLRHLLVTKIQGFSSKHFGANFIAYQMGSRIFWSGEYITRLVWVAAAYRNDKEFLRVFLNEKLTYPVSNALYFAKAFFLLARVGSIWLLLCCLCTFILWARHFVSFSLCLSKRFKNSHFIGSFCSGDSSEFLPPTPGDYQIRLPDWPSMLRRTTISIAKYRGNCFQVCHESLRKYKITPISLCFS